MNKIYHYCYNSIFKKILDDELEYFETPRYCIKIASYRFYQKINLKEVNLKNIEIIGEGCFYKCSNLKIVKLDKTLKEIKIYAFKECSSLKDVYYNGTMAEWKENVSYSDSVVYNPFKDTLVTEIQCIDGNVSI